MSCEVEKVKCLLSLFICFIYFWLFVLFCIVLVLGLKFSISSFSGRCCTIDLIPQSLPQPFKNKSSNSMHKDRSIMINKTNSIHKSRELGSFCYSLSQILSHWATGLNWRCLQRHIRFIST